MGGRLSGAERLVVGGSLVAVALVAWAYLFYDARGLSGTDCCTLLSATGTSASALVGLFTMWSVMMIAMMLPTALPMVLMFAAVARNRRRAGRAYVPVSIFVAGYIVVWCAFSGAAAAAQWFLHRQALLSPAMATNSAFVAAVLLFAAGIFQFTNLKNACLAQCRSPFEFIMTRWREGWRGALRMGIEHGAFCAGCCWALMLLLFLVGVMNLYWVALLTTVVAVEKMMPTRARISAALGAILIGWGLFILIQAQAKFG